jgi:hypothetical protein
MSSHQSFDDGLPAPFIDSDDDDAIQAVSVDPDDYAETAAGDLPSHVNSRTYQSEEAFQREKAGYTAKVDDGDSLGLLLKTAPCLAVGELASHDVMGGVNGLTLNLRKGEEDVGVEKDAHDAVNGLEVNGDETGGSSKYKLSKREIQLLGYAAGELYFRREWSRLSALCRAVEEKCEVDAKLHASLVKWNDKAIRRMRSAGKEGPRCATP